MIYLDQLFKCKPLIWHILLTSRWRAPEEPLESPWRTPGETLESPVLFSPWRAPDTPEELQGSSWRAPGEPMVSLYYFFVFLADIFSDMALSCWKLHVDVYVVASQERLAIFSLRLRCQLGSNKKVQLRAGRAFLRSEFACRGMLI